MKVQCGQCPAKYAVADERVRDKKVRIRCKRCNAAIVVDGKVDPPLVTSTPARRSARPLPASLFPESLPPVVDNEPESRPSPRPVAHTIMGGLEAPAAERLREVQFSSPVMPAQGANRSPASPGGAMASAEPRVGMPAAHRGFTDPPVGAAPMRWRVALTKQDLRWMTTSEIAQAYRSGAVKLETFVFRTGMPTWVTLLEVPEIAEALAEGEDGSVVSPLAPPPRRAPSSRPPPRKTARRDQSQGSSPDATASLHDDDGESEDPFALVSARSNGHYEPAHDYADRGTDAEDTSFPSLPPIEPDASEALRVPSATDTARAEEESDEGSEDNVAHADTSLPGNLDRGAPTPSLPFASVQQSSGSGRWTWIVILVVLIAAAVLALLGPRFGFKVL